MTIDEISKCEISEGIYKEALMDMRGKIKSYKEAKDEGMKIFEDHYRSLCSAFTALYELAENENPIMLIDGELCTHYQKITDDYKQSIRDVLKVVDEMGKYGDMDSIMGQTIIHIDYDKNTLDVLRQRIEKLGEK